MKIYIDWDEKQWYTEKDYFFEGLVDSGELETYSDFLANVYVDRFDELLNLSEEEKTYLYERYKTYLRLDFEDKVKSGILDYTVLCVEKKDDITVKEIL